ncbi:MAG: molybdopterin biosynthesis protein [Synergistetes bacterium]|nr:molybdopterin biosynthesis protein [Synergistota bacterium]
MAYLKLVGKDEALRQWFDALVFDYSESEVLDLADAYGRVLSKPIWADRSLPSYYASSVDGIAVCSEDTAFATESRPVKLRRDVDFVWVNTGQEIPSEYDAVIMVEDVDWIDEDNVEIRSPIAPGSNVRMVGEDVVVGDMLFPAYHLLDAVSVSLLVANGIKSVEVLKKPRVGFIPTGDEIVEPAEPIKPGQSYESNSFILKGLVEQWGGSFFRYKTIVPDKPDEIAKVVKEVLKVADVVVIGAGSSAGKKDFTARVIESMGRLLVHGLRLRPSKPTLLGVIGEKPVVGLPGYPFAALVAAELFLKPLIYRMLHRPLPCEEVVDARIVKRVVSPMGVEEYLRVMVGKVDDNWVALPLPRGSSLLSPSVRQDGVLVIPMEVIEYKPFDRVNIALKRNISELENTLLCVGSHDIVLDMIDAMMRQNFPGYRMVSASVGSLGGIFSLKRGGSHIGGVHLLDTETGEYNVSYVDRYLSDEDAVLIDFLYRLQGIMVPKGNPKGIKGIEDLLRDDVRFVNRQKGSGTRVLLDYKLSVMGLSPSDIKGYDDEEFTHIGVAIRVASGRADAGLGILSAANALGLDFIPVGEEKYDLLTLRRFLELPQMNVLFDVIDSGEFRRRLDALGGYRWARN